MDDVLCTLVANQHLRPNQDLQMTIDNDHYNKACVFWGIKLDFSHFEGTDPANFEYHQTPPAQRLLMASYHIEGETLVWYQDALDTGQFNSWETLVWALLILFGPTTYDDPMETLTCLKQTSTVIAYKAQFEALSNRLRGLSDYYKLSCFLNGLKDEIIPPVRMPSPLNLNAAFGLAKILEEYLSATKKFNKPMVEKTNAYGAGSNSASWRKYGDGGSRTRKYNPQIQNISSTTMDKKGVKAFVTIVTKNGTRTMFAKPQKSTYCMAKKR